MNFFTLEILLNNRDVFIKIISRSYPISNALLEKYQDYWDWEGIAANKHIGWTKQLTQKYQSKLFTKKLPHHAAITWSVALIEELISQEKITWENLMWQGGIFETPQTTALCLSKWSEEGEHVQPQFRNDKYDLLNYRYIQFGRWGKDASLWAAQTVESIPELKWNLFSGIQGFPWTLDFIEKHEHQLDWDILSKNDHIPWTTDFIERKKHLLNWQNLSCNRGIPWSIDFLTKFAEYIDWKLLLNVLINTNFSPPPNLKLQKIIEVFPEKIHWAYPNIDEGGWQGTFSGVFNREEMYWTPELFYKAQPYIESCFQQLQSTVFNIGDDDDDGGTWSIPKTDKKGNPVYWTYFAETKNWSPEFFDLMLARQTDMGITTINWERICVFAKYLWTPTFVANHKTTICKHMATGRYLGWTLAANRHFPWKNYFAEFLPYLTDRCFKDISANPSFPLSVQFLKEYEEKLEWGFNGIESRDDLSEEIIAHFINKLDWDVICRKGNTSIEVLKKFPAHVNWTLLSRRKNLDIDSLDFNLPWDWREVFQDQHIDFAKYLPAETLEKFLKNL